MLAQSSPHPQPCWRAWLLIFFGVLQFRELEATLPHRLQPLTPCGSQRDRRLKCTEAAQT